MTSAQVVPPSLERCHWMVGVGRPVPTTVKDALAGAVTVWPTGWVVMLGATFTVRVAALLVAAVPMPLLRTTRNLAP